MSDLAEALGRVPSGIFILTAKHGEKSSGMLASWVVQAAFNPPAVTVAVNKERYMADWLAEGAGVAINILADDEKDMISHFGRGVNPDDAPFRGVNLLEGEAKAPVLADALAFVAGDVAASMDAGDHVIFLVRLTSGRMLREGAPMLHVRKNGLRY